MNLEKFIELVFANPTNISIQYSNINGEEKLLVNGEEVRKDEDFDDTDTLEMIKEYKGRLEELEDDIFVEAMEEASEELNLSEVDTLLNKEHLTEDEAETVLNNISVIDSIIYDTIQSRIDYYVALKEMYL